MLILWIEPLTGSLSCASFIWFHPFLRACYFYFGFFMAAEQQLARCVGQGHGVTWGGRPHVHAGDQWEIQPGELPLSPGPWHGGGCTAWPPGISYERYDLVKHCQSFAKVRQHYCYMSSLTCCHMSTLYISIKSSGKWIKRPCISLPWQTD